MQGIFMTNYETKMQKFCWQIALYFVNRYSIGPLVEMQHEFKIQFWSIRVKESAVVILGDDDRKDKEIFY